MDEDGSRGLFVHDEPSQDSDDSVSVTSTVYDDDQVEFAVDRILADGVRWDGEPMWLVLWDKYPVRAATWEPRENFTNSIPLDEWEITKKRIDDGLETAFDVDKWEDDKEKRKRKRERKRRALEAEKKRSAIPRKKGVARPRTRKRSDEPSSDSDHREPKRKPTSISNALPTESKKTDAGNVPPDKSKEPARQATDSNRPSRPSPAMAIATEINHPSRPSSKPAKATETNPPSRPSSATAKATDRPVTANPVLSGQSNGTSGSSTGPSQRPAPAAPMQRSATAARNNNMSMFTGKAPMPSTAKRSSNSASANQKVTVMTNDPSARKKSTTRSAPRGAPGTYKNLKHKHWAQKRNSEEQAPDPTNLKLFNPSERRTGINRVLAESEAGVVATGPTQSIAPPNTATPGTANSHTTASHTAAPNPNTPKTAAPHTAAAITVAEPLSRNTPSAHTHPEPRPIPPTTNSTGAIASASAAKGPSIRDRSNSQPNVESLSLNAAAIRPTAKIQNTVGNGDIIPPRAPVATMVNSTDNTQTQHNPASGLRQPEAPAATMVNATDNTQTQNDPASGPRQPEAPMATMVSSTDNTRTQSGSVSEPRQRGTQYTAAQPRTDTPDNSIRKDLDGFTCRRWLKNQWYSEHCKFGAECSYKHHYCVKVEPKLRGRQCEHWIHGHCKFTDELCAYWHAELDPRTGEPPNVSSSYNDLEHILRTMRPVASSLTTVSSSSLPATTAMPTPSSTTVRPKPGTTCRKWFLGTCKKSPQQCLNGAHHCCDRIEAKKMQVCKFWKWSGHCERTDAACEYYHQYFDSAGKPLRERRFETCPAWKVGACPKGEDQCEYFHVYWDPSSQQHDPADGFMDIDDVDTDEPGFFHDTSTSAPGVSTKQPPPELQAFSQPSRPPPPATDGAVIHQTPQLNQASLSQTPRSLTPRVPISGSDEEVFMNEMIVKLCEEQLQLKSERLFAGTSGVVFEKVVCVMFPPSEVAEITLITRYLKAIGATVVNPEVPGSWKAFIREPQDKSRKRSGVILYHPSVFNFHQLYSFRNTLHSGSFNHFQLGLDAVLQDHPQAKTVYSCVRLFPHGDLVLLPDDLIFYEPVKALQVIKTFQVNLERKPAFSRHERLVFRPGLREVLAQLKTREDEQAARVELYTTIEELYEKYEKMKFPGSMQPKYVNIVSLPIQYAPDYAAMWEEDQARATSWLVEWFAGWCLLQRERFRRFTIITSNEKGEVAMKWWRRYQHVDVWSPEKYLRLKKR